MTEQRLDGEDYQMVILDSISSSNNYDGRALLLRKYSTSAATMALTALIAIEVNFEVSFDREFNSTIDKLELNLTSLNKYNDYENM